MKKLNREIRNTEVEITEKRQVTIRAETEGMAERTFWLPMILLWGWDCGGIIENK